MAAVLCGGNSALVFEHGGPESGELPLLSRRAVFIHIQVVFIEWVLVFLEQFGHTRRQKVDNVDEDKSGDFSGFGTGKSDGQASLEECLPDVAEVVIFWGSDDTCKHCDSGVQFGGVVRC